MSPAASEFLFELLNLGLLVGGLGWFLFGPIRAALAAETRAHAATQAEIDARRAKVDEDQRALDARRSELESRQVSDAAARVALAEAEAARLREVAKHEVLTHRAAWEAERSARELVMMEDVEAAAAEVAATTVRRLLQQAGGPDLELALVQVALASLPAAPSPPITVELARPPSPAIDAALATALPAGFQLRTVPELGGGARILSSDGLADASALGLATETAGSVRAALKTGRAPGPAHG